MASRLDPWPQPFSIGWGCTAQGLSRVLSPSISPHPMNVFPRPPPSAPTQLCLSPGEGSRTRVLVAAVEACLCPPGLAGSLLPINHRLCLLWGPGCKLPAWAGRVRPSLCPGQTSCGHLAHLRPVRLQVLPLRSVRSLGGGLTSPSCGFPRVPLLGCRRWFPFPRPLLRPVSFGSLSIPGPAAHPLLCQPTSTGEILWLPVC